MGQEEPTVEARQQDKGSPEDHLQRQVAPAGQTRGKNHDELAKHHLEDARHQQEHSATELRRVPTFQHKAEFRSLSITVPWVSASRWCCACTSLAIYGRTATAKSDSAADKSGCCSKSTAGP